MVRAKVCYGEMPSELEYALNTFLNEIGWDKILHISYSQGDMKAYSRYSALVVYKI